MKNKQQTCAECEYFIRHYILWENARYIPLEFGHCTYPRCKNRKTNSPACTYFKKGLSQ